LTRTPIDSEVENLAGSTVSSVAISRAIFGGRVLRKSFQHRRLWLAHVLLDEIPIPPPPPSYPPPPPPPSPPPSRAPIATIMTIESTCRPSRKSADRGPLPFSSRPFLGLPQTRPVLKKPVGVKGLEFGLIVLVDRMTRAAEARSASCAAPTTLICRRRRRGMPRAWRPFASRNHEPCQPRRRSANVLEVFVRGG